MFPTVFEWIWDMGHVVFMGLFWLVMVALLTGIVIVLGRTVIDTSREANDYDNEWSEQR